MPTDDLGIERDPAEVPDELGITRGPSASARPTAHTDQFGISYDTGASARPPRLTDAGQPTRAYSTPGQLGGNAPRTPEFSTGISGNPASAAGSLSEITDSEKYNAMVPRQFSQHSVLQTSMPSANGYSTRDFQERMLPGLAKPLPSVNGTSQDSYDKSLIMRLNGLDEGQ
jgi:hypothetical protein